MKFSGKPHVNFVPWIPVWFMILFLTRASIVHAAGETADPGTPAPPTAAAPAVQTETAPAPVTATSPEPTQASSRKKSKGKRSAEKETEGTEAPDRAHFQNDTVIKSQYRLNGEPLEVDPD